MSLLDIQQKQQIRQERQIYSTIQIFSKNQQQNIVSISSQKTKMVKTTSSFVVILFTLLTATVSGQDTDVSPNVTYIVLLCYAIW